MQPLQSQITNQYGMSQCPDNPSAIISDCGDSIPCQYDYTLLNSKVLGTNAKNEWNVFTAERVDAIRTCKFSVFLKLNLDLDNSCGPINIEYPEYLTKTSSMASAYLQGDVARFECFQSHWIKGVHEYRCNLVFFNIIKLKFRWNYCGQKPSK